MSVCKRCDVPQHWSGMPRECAFPDGSDFLTSNWNCGTMNDLRSLVEENRIYGEDCSSGTLYFSVPRIDDDEWAEDDGFVTLAWYKNRGRTDTAFVFHYGEQPYPLTLSLAERIIDTERARRA